MYKLALLSLAFCLTTEVINKYYCLNTSFVDMRRVKSIFWNNRRQSFITNSPCEGHLHAAVLNCWTELKVIRKFDMKEKLLKAYGKSGKDPSKLGARLQRSRWTCAGFKWVGQNYTHTISSLIDLSIGVGAQQEAFSMALWFRCQTTEIVELKEVFVYLFCFNTVSDTKLIWLLIQLPCVKNVSPPHTHVKSKSFHSPIRSRPTHFSSMLGSIANRLFLLFF